MICEFSNHALAQLERRGIGKELVENIIINPENISNQDDGISIYSKVVNEGSKFFIFIEFL